MSEHLSSIPDPATPQAHALIQRCRQVGTATWSDAMDQLQVEGVVSGLPMRSGTGRCAGFAATARGEVRELGGFDLSDFGQDRMIASAGRTQVLVVAVDGAEVSAMGGIVALSAYKKGIEGVVIDGACRDIEDIRKCGLWVASRHVTPRTGKRRMRLSGFGEDVELCGHRVHAGDLVVGDATGLVVVPRAALLRVLSLAEQILQSDTRLEGAVSSGQALDEAARGVKASQ
jgi:regulator of RNase E activity RraA